MDAYKIMFARLVIKIVLCMQLESQDDMSKAALWLELYISQECIYACNGLTSPAVSDRASGFYSCLILIRNAWKTLGGRLIHGHVLRDWDLIYKHFCLLQTFPLSYLEWNIKYYVVNNT